MIFATQRGQAIPTLAQIQGEGRKLARQKQRRHAFLSFTLSFLVTLLGGVMLLVLFLPVLQVSGSSMEPTLQDGDILVLYRPNTIRAGEMCGVYAQDRLILKRVIGLPGDVVNMDERGHVFVNGAELLEPYVSQKTVGNCDLTFPITVPEDSLFVMGNHRETSIDSRNSLIGCVKTDQFLAMWWRVYGLRRASVGWSDDQILSAIAGFELTGWLQTGTLNAHFLFRWEAQYDPY